MLGIKIETWCSSLHNPHRFDRSRKCVTLDAQIISVVSLLIVVIDIMSLCELVFKGVFIFYFF